MPINPEAPLAVPGSILDTDLYKLTMQQAVLYHFPEVKATYRFTNRSYNVQFSVQCVERFRAAISRFPELALTPAEKDWLTTTCPYLTQDYITYLSSYRYQPEQVEVIFSPASQTSEFGNISIDIKGPWPETIMWEVPLMACLSETYFQVDDTDWDYDGQEDLAFQKAKAILEAGCAFSEFGTRRRRSFAAQDMVMQGLMRASNLCETGAFNGTSNVHLAHKYDVAPIGTIAHEWFMGVAALKGYEKANVIALTLWEDVYYAKDKATLIALTDTFSTGCFFSELAKDPEKMRRWHGIRQDSGDPFSFGRRAKRFYELLEIDPCRKTIVFSDALDVGKVLRLKAQCDTDGLQQVAFGIGTFLTNDFWSLSSGCRIKSKPLNIVIKLSSVNDLPCIKISDDLNKNTGDAIVVENVKRTLQIPYN